MPKSKSTRQSLKNRIGSVTAGIRGGLGSISKLRRQPRKKVNNYSHPGQGSSSSGGPSVTFVDHTSQANAPGPAPPPAGSAAHSTQDFTESWSGPRPAKDGPVTVHLQTRTSGATITSRPVFVSGIVVPLATKGRPAAPEPVGGVRVSTTQAAKDPKSKNYSPEAPRNQGIVDAHKGHIMALELGAPDVSENIVPQWANWQANGLWRGMERDIESWAKDLGKSKQQLLFEAQVVYRTAADEGLSSLKQWGFPKEFIVRATVLDQNGQKTGEWRQWTHDPAQDVTDDKVFERTAFLVELQQGEAVDWPDPVALFGSKKDLFKAVEKTIGRALTSKEKTSLEEGELPDSLKQPEDSDSESEDGDADGEDGNSDGEDRNSDGEDVDLAAGFDAMSIHPVDDEPVDDEPVDDEPVDDEPMDTDAMDVDAVDTGPGTAGPSQSPITVLTFQRTLDLMNQAYDSDESDFTP
jgi:hypothetical protein